MTAATGLDIVLEVNRLTVRYGGAVAVNGLSLSARAGALTGLIGPNGAGKTTTFNACSGLLRPSDGRIRLDGVDVTRLGPAGRARRGLGRTFQRMELYRSMTVRENLIVGHEAGLVGTNPIRQLIAGPGQRRATARAVDESLARCGLTSLADRIAGTLSTGQQRLVELARACAGRYRILLLDEPSSGLDHDETIRFGRILRSLVDERGIGILLVEHDMTLVMSVCDYLYVLDFGSLIFEGTPAEARVSTIVRAAYLGSEELEPVAGSGGPA
jgi:ABC-type branched-subunit amino acid transport system ATPase component